RDRARATREGLGALRNGRREWWDLGRGCRRRATTETARTECQPERDERETHRASVPRLRRAHAITSITHSRIAPRTASSKSSPTRLPTSMPPTGVAGVTTVISWP